MNDKKCPYCGTTFKPKHFNQNYCQSKCQKAINSKKTNEKRKMATYCRRNGLEVAAKQERENKKIALKREVRELLIDLQLKRWWVETVDIFRIINLQVKIWGEHDYMSKHQPEDDPEKYYNRVILKMIAYLQK